jgi:hypothetical protein
LRCERWQQTQHVAQRDVEFKASHVMPQTSMNAIAERNVTIRMPIEDDLIGFVEYRRITICRAVEKQDLVPAIEGPSAELRLGCDPSAYRLDRRNESKEFVDSLRN